MKPVELKVARIGNSRGVRLPAGTLERYQVGLVLIMEERPEGILLRAPAPASPMLSWEDTAAAMAAEGEDWTSREAAAADGLRDVPWEPQREGRVAEPRREYRARRRPRER